METKEKLLESAILLFLEHEYETVTMESIASNLNVTKGALYHYFKGKDEVYKQAFIMMIDRHNDEMQKLFLNRDLSLIQVLTHFILKLGLDEEHGRISERIVNSYALMFDAIKRFPELKSHLSASYQLLIECIIQHIDTDKNMCICHDKTESKQMALRIVALIEGYAMLNSFTHQSISTEAVQAGLLFAIGYTQ